MSSPSHLISLGWDGRDTDLRANMLKHCSQARLDSHKGPHQSMPYNKAVSSLCLVTSDKESPSLQLYPERKTNSYLTIPRSMYQSCDSLTIGQPAASLLTLYDKSAVDKQIIKVYAECLRPDLEYKTVCVGPSTTSKEIILYLLGKFKMKHRDPKLFYLTMEVMIRLSGNSVTRVISLEDESHPTELVSCTPWANLKFRLKSRKGGLVRIYDSVLMKESQYKSLLISETTTAEDVIRILLSCYRLKTDETDSYCIYLEGDNLERRLEITERPLELVSGLRERNKLVLRRARQWRDRAQSADTELAEARSFLAGPVKSRLTRHQHQRREARSRRLSLADSRSESYLGTYQKRRHRQSLCSSDSGESASLSDSSGGGADFAADGLIDRVVDDDDDDDDVFLEDDFTGSECEDGLSDGLRSLAVNPSTSHENVADRLAESEPDHCSSQPVAGAGFIANSDLW